MDGYWCPIFIYFWMFPLIGWKLLSDFSIEAQKHHDIDYLLLDAKLLATSRIEHPNFDESSSC